MPTAAQAPSVTLGTYTKSIHAAAGARNEIDPERAGHKARATAGRYALQRTAQGLLWQVGKDWREQHRTCWCTRSMKRLGETVGVFRNVDGSGASLTGLNRCGEVWTCPVCAAKIAEERRKELNTAMVAWLMAGGAAYLITLTFPHEADHNLFVMLERFANARQRLQNSRAWKRIMKDAGRIGGVASLELTCSAENGWHPHLHLLVFANRKGLGEGEPVNHAGDLDSELIGELRKAWCNILLKTGLATGRDMPAMIGGTDDNQTGRAFNVRGGDKAAEYIAKYGRDERHGASAEMTASYCKVGTVERQGMAHFTPFQLLEWAGRNDAWAIAKFCEYAKAIAGKRALTWSPGLKKQLLGTDDERTDEEIAADDSRPEQAEVGVLEREQFQAIMKRNRLPDFIRYVAESAYSQGDIDDYVNAIAATPATHGGAVTIRTLFGGGEAGPRRVIN